MPNVREWSGVHWVMTFAKGTFLGKQKEVLRKLRASIGSSRKSLKECSLSEAEGSSITLALEWNQPATYNAVYSYCKTRGVGALDVQWTLVLADQDRLVEPASGASAGIPPPQPTSGDVMPRNIGTSVPQAIGSPAAAFPPGMAAALLSFKLAQMIQFGAHTRFEDLYDSRERVGEGSFGMRYTAVRRADQRDVIVREAKQTDDLLEITAEAILLGIFRHPNVLRLLDTHADADHIRLVVPFYSTNLAMAMHSRISLQIPCITRQISSALHHVHAAGLVHNDVKPASIQFEPNEAGGLVVLGDFGRAFVQGVHKPPQISASGMRNEALLYQAPEILLGDAAYGQPVDMWATGCILGEMALGRPMFTAHGAMHTVTAIMKLLGSPVAKDMSLFANLPHWSAEFTAFPQRAWWQVQADALGDDGVGPHE